MLRNKKKISGAILSMLLLIVITALAQTIPPKGPMSNGSAGNKIDVDTAIGVPTNDDPWKEMDKIVVANNSSQGVSLSGTIKLIDDNGDKERVLEEQNFEYSFLGVNMYQKIGSMEFISKPGLLLVADHDNKLIAVSNSGNGESKSNKLFDIKEFKKMMEERKSSAKVSQSGEQKLLTIENIQDPQIQGFRIYYDPATYQIYKILIGVLRLTPLSDDESSIEEIPGSFDDKTDNKEGETDSTSDNEIETYTYYLEIIYSEMKILGIKEDAFHPEDKFIIKTKGKIELKTAFSKYQLVNNGVENDKQREPQQ